MESYRWHQAIILCGQHQRVSRCAVPLHKHGGVVRVPNLTLIQLSIAEASPATCLASTQTQSCTLISLFLKQHADITTLEGDYDLFRFETPLLTLIIAQILPFGTAAIASLVPICLPT